MLIHERLQLALTWAGGDYPWMSTNVIATLVVGLIVCLGFILWQWKCPLPPLIPCKTLATELVAGIGLQNAQRKLTRSQYIFSRSV